MIEETIPALRNRTYSPLPSPLPSYSELNVSDSEDWSFSNSDANPCKTIVDPWFGGGDDDVNDDGGTYDDDEGDNIDNNIDNPHQHFDAKLSPSTSLAPEHWETLFME